MSSYMDSTLEIFDSSMKRFEDLQKNYFSDVKLSKSEAT